MKHLLYIFLVLATLLTGLYLLPKHTPLFEYYRLRPVFEVATIVFLIGVLCLYGREKRQVKMIFSRLSQKNFFLDLAIQCGGIYIWEFKDEEFFFEYPVGDQSLRIELEEMWRLIHPDDLTAFKLLWQSLWKADKEVFQCRARFAGSDYEWWEFRFSAMPALDNAERGKDVSGILININDMKKREKELILMRGYEQKFLANMSHEIRTPLNAIVGFSNILAETDVLEEKQEYAEIIENNNALLLQLINDILDLSKIEAGTLEFVYSDVDVNTLLSDLERSMSKRVVNENVRLVFERKEKDCYVSIAKNRLMQVIINLLTNAIKFTDQGSISYGYSCLNKKMLRFYVSDTGRGISVEQQEAIFDRFVKLDSFAQGTGLGLSICRMIVDHLGGEMGVESEIGKGSTFWFTFPYKAPEKPVREDVIFEKIKVEKDKLTVLIAEDNAGNFKLFETILKNDYTIVHAWNGKEAVELFKEYEPHIVLMDINMPEMNGYEATKEIRKLSEVIPIIAVTAYAFASDEEQVMNSGFDAYASKPLNASALKKQMVDLLRARVFVI